MKRCKVVDTATRTSPMGSEFWVLTLQCGAVVERLARKRNSRRVRPSPARVQHEHAEPESEQ